MRGVLRSELLVVAAALEPAEEWEGEQQQQQQREELPRREQHLCTAEGPLVCVAGSNDHRLLHLRRSARPASAAFRSSS
jgi:hypothetical protein